MKRYITARRGSPEWYKEYRGHCEKFAREFREVLDRDGHRRIHLCNAEKFLSTWSDVKFNPKADVDPVRDATDFLLSSLLDGCQAAYALLRDGDDVRFCFSVWHDNAVDWFPEGYEIENEVLFEGCHEAR